MTGPWKWLARLTSDVEPYTQTTETDSSWLDGDFEATRKAGHTESLDDYAARTRNPNFRTARQRHQQGDQ